MSRSIVLAEQRTPTRVVIVERFFRVRPDMVDFAPYVIKTVEFHKFGSNAEALRFAKQRYRLTWEVPENAKTKGTSRSG